MSCACLNTCVCPMCRSGELTIQDDAVHCASCARSYEIVDGVPLLLPDDDDDVRTRYRDNYDRIAEDDLRTPIVENRDALLHKALLRFIGPAEGMSILDIGSAQANYLIQLNDAAKRVAVDIALPYLREIPVESGIVRVCGDAERLPVDPAAFDIIVISDVLEHLLDPEKLVQLLRCCPGSTRIIIHIPWEESLEPYQKLDYEFVHLRSFNNYNLRHLFRDFYLKRSRLELPYMPYPAIFRMEKWMPRTLFNGLLYTYFHTDLKHIEYQHRARWIHGLPLRQSWLLRFYPAQFRIFEFRKWERRSRWCPSAVQNLMSSWWSRSQRKQAPPATEAECPQHG